MFLTYICITFAPPTMHPTTIVATANRLAENETVFNMKIDKTLKAKGLVAAKQMNSDLSKEVRKAIVDIVNAHEAKYGKIELPKP